MEIYPSCRNKFQCEINEITDSNHRKWQGGFRSLPAPNSHTSPAFVRKNLGHADQRDKTAEEGWISFIKDHVYLNPSTGKKEKHARASLFQIHRHHRVSELGTYTEVNIFWGSNPDHVQQGDKGKRGDDAPVKHNNSFSPVIRRCIWNNLRLTTSFYNIREKTNNIIVDPNLKEASFSNDLSVEDVCSWDLIHWYP